MAPRFCYGGFTLASENSQFTFWLVRQIGHRREPSIRWLDPNFVIHGCANSLFAAKMSLLALRQIERCILWHTEY